MSRFERLLEDPLCRPGVRGELARDLERRRHPFEPRRTFLERGVEEVLPVDVEKVEEERNDSLGRRRAVDLRDGVLEGGRAMLAHPQRLAVEHDLGHVKATDRGDDSRERARDVVEIPRVYADVVAATMDLDPDSVELPLDRRAVEGLDSLEDALRGRGEHRQERMKELEADRPQPVLALGERDRGSVREVAREHERPAHQLHAHARRLRDRTDHDTGERALSETARQQVSHEVGLLFGRPTQELTEELLAFRDGAGARRRLDLRDRSVELVDDERRLRLRRARYPVDRCVADADSASEYPSGTRPRPESRSGRAASGVRPGWRPSESVSSYRSWRGTPRLLRRARSSLGRQESSPPSFR